MGGIACLEGNLALAAALNAMMAWYGAARC